MPLPSSAELFYGLRLTDEQKAYANSICDNLVTFCAARSGSGKTTVAVGTAKILKKPVHYIFPTVEEGALGHTTGDVKQKESKYLTSLYDALIEIGETPLQAIIQDDVKLAKNGHGWIYAYSHNYMRGGNIKNSIVIIDEAQNFTIAELMKVLTRIHDSCHVVICGDPNQCDIKPSKSGFVPYLKHYSGQEFAKVLNLTKNFRGVISAHAETIAI